MHATADPGARYFILVSHIVDRGPPIIQDFPCYVKRKLGWEARTLGGPLPGNSDKASNGLTLSTLQHYLLLYLFFSCNIIQHSWGMNWILLPPNILNFSKCIHRTSQPWNHLNSTLVYSLLELSLGVCLITCFPGACHQSVNHLT